MWTVGAFVAIVASFVAATTFTERRMGRITSASQRLSDVSVPAMVAAARMHRDLTQLAALLGVRGTDTAIDDLLAKLDDDERRASALALPDDQQARWAELEQDLVALRRKMAPYVSEQSARTREDLRLALMQGILELGSSLDRITRAESERAAKARGDVESARAWSARFTYGLDAVCIMLAGLVAVQTIRMQRARRHAIEQHVDDLEDFAVRVAHDIRSPLTPALLALQKVGVRLPKEDPARETVERGIRSVHTIARTVDGLLAFASAGAKPEPEESCSLPGTIDAVVAEYLDEASAKAIVFAVESAEPGLRVACSTGVLASVIGNLVGNAITFMRESETRRIVIRARPEGPNVHVEVEDSGPGLPDGADKCIFEPYVRADGSTRGLGLGLATVKRLVTAHGGSFGVRRAQPSGCIFWVDLPAGPPAEQRAKVESVDANRNRKR